MFPLFSPLNKLTQLVGSLRPGTERHGKRTVCYATDTGFSLDIYPGGTHWQVDCTARTEKPTWVASKNVFPLRDIEAKLHQAGLLSWPETVAQLQASQTMQFSVCLVRLTEITLIVTVAVVTDKYLYAVKRESYDPSVHGTGYTLLTQEKDLMNFYHLAGIQAEDTPKPALVDVDHAPARPSYPPQNVPNLLLRLGNQLNSLPLKQEDRFWGGEK